MSTVVLALTTVALAIALVVFDRRQGGLGLLIMLVPLALVGLGVASTGLAVARGDRRARPWPGRVGLTVAWVVTALMALIAVALLSAPPYEPT